MKPHRPSTRFSRVLASSSIAVLALFAMRAGAQSTDPAAEVEVLTRGPVHEAFAEPGAYDPVQGQVVLQEPPTVIEEIPPEEKPQGDNVIWMSGFWSWDSERNDFIWISGIWRIPPPGYRWIPGYWTHVDGGWTWTRGYWLQIQTTEVRYLPAPPPSLEIGPSYNPPSASNTGSNSHSVKV